ncbi:TolB family protein [Dyadobacter luticola]|uniref:Uncharacterized protein n=1 Tax=Dyadobacter luticola TaxID=1979387 RepID=A0A5R9L354_9BACT|nr:PD40 domain-containing protein [Dyadobacter luticola]TLV02725.1 hypothetical protein FEN17_03645 [Dyadobacter luticola]
MKKLLILTLAVVCNSCWLDPFYDRSAGKFLKDVVPLEEFNSEFDDYNSDLPHNKSGHVFLTFSSKREKKDYFNLVYIPAELKYDKRLSIQKISKSGIIYDDVTDNATTAVFANTANGNFNVYGPRTISMRRDLASDGNTPDDVLFFYADDSEGNMEIKYMVRGAHGYEGPFKFDLLNSQKDDGYPTFSFDGDKIYFSSNRDGNFDIYEVSIDGAGYDRLSTATFIKPEKFAIRKVEELSSPADDKCPYLYGDIMVFVSDRPGGKGGTDIYYSKLENGKWSTPVNAGDRINTSFNEYRPILPSLNHFNYYLMIFSSDRPGGKGGFDLYMTGLIDRW